MPSSPVQHVVEKLRNAVILEQTSDGILLNSYLGQRCEHAVAELVRRHGPMVWGVCFRLLRSRQDAEDCYQATFLVLVRKADTVRPGSRIGAWLHGVAYHTALKARHLAARRGHMEQLVERLPESTPQADTAADARQFLDYGLNELPEKYRLPIVLCELEGRTIKDVAEELGCPIGTVAGWLARGRDLLARRLAKHGVAGVAITAVVAESARAAPPTLTLPSASATVVALAQATMQTLFLAKLKSWLVAFAAALVLTLGVGGSLYHTFGNEPASNGVVAAPVAETEKRPEQQIDAVKPVDKQPIVPETAWGKEVDGVQYGVEFKDNRNAYRVGEDVTFVLKARNVTAEPIALEQIEITDTSSGARNAVGAAVPAVLEAKGTETKTRPRYLKGALPPAAIRDIRLPAKETVILGEVAYRLGDIDNGPHIAAGVGSHRVRFDTVCWLPGHKRPTGTLEMLVTDSIAWGKAVDGVEYGFEFKDDRRQYRLGEDITLILKARNTTGKVVSIDQVEITGVASRAQGASGAAVPKVADAKWKEIRVFPLAVAGREPLAAVHMIQLAAKETATLGQVSYSAGDVQGGLPHLELKPGVYSIRFDTVCWLPGHKRPTGTLEMVVTDTTAWGKAVDSVEYGFEFKGNQNRYRIGEKVNFVLKARNTTDKPVSFEQVQVTPVMSRPIGMDVIGFTEPIVVDSTGKKIVTVHHLRSLFFKGFWSTDRENWAGFSPHHS